MCCIDMIMYVCSGRGPPSPWSWTSVLPTGSWDTSYSRFITIQWQTQRSWTTMSPSRPRCMERRPSTWWLRSSMKWKWGKMIHLLTLAVVSKQVLGHWGFRKTSLWFNTLTLVSYLQEWGRWCCRLLQLPTVNTTMGLRKQTLQLPMQR